MWLSYNCLKSFNILLLILICHSKERELAAALFLVSTTSAYICVVATLLWVSIFETVYMSLPFSTSRVAFVRLNVWNVTFFVMPASLANLFSGAYAMVLVRQKKTVSDSPFPQYDKASSLMYTISILSLFSIVLMMHGPPSGATVMCSHLRVRMSLILSPVNTANIAASFRTGYSHGVYLSI